MGPEMTKEGNESFLRSQHGQEKNNQGGTPQADGSNVDAGGQVDLAALKAQIAGQTSSADATAKNEPTQNDQSNIITAATEKMLAGKFKDVSALEESYVNLEKKLGQKSDLEKVGEKLLQYSGRDVDQLKADLELAIEQTAPTRLTSEQETTVQNTSDPRVEKLEKQLQAIQVQNLLGQLDREKAELFSKFPESKKYEGTLTDLWKNVDTKESLESIYEKRFKPTEQAIATTVIEKSKDSFQAESSVGKITGGIEAIDTNKLTLSQLAQILPRREV